MTRLSRGVLRFVGGVVGLFSILVIGVFLASEWILKQSYPVEIREVTIPDDPASIAEGERLARVRGCYGGCHGPNAEGQDFFGFTATNLTRKVREYSVAELDMAIRQGIHPPSRTGLTAMPSPMYANLSDEDFGRILGFLMSLPEKDDDLPDRSMNPLLRIFLLTGDFKIAPEAISDLDDVSAAKSTDPVAHGRYLALTSCSECHGWDLRGVEFGGTPDLAVTSAYTLEEFRTLMGAGKSNSGRDLGLMAAMGRSRFTYLTPEEVDSLYAYLTSDGFLMALR